MFSTFLVNTSVIYNQKFTEIQVTLNGVDNPTGGTVWLGIIKNDGTKIKFGASIDPTSIPDASNKLYKASFY